MHPIPVIENKKRFDELLGNAQRMPTGLLEMRRHAVMDHMQGRAQPSLRRLAYHYLSNVRSKTTHGDVDIVVLPIRDEDFHLGPTMDYDLVTGLSKATLRRQPNKLFGEGMQFMAIDEQGPYQVDLLWARSIEELDFMYHYHSFGGIGALLGGQAKAVGLELRTRGLFARLPESISMTSSALGGAGTRVLVTQNWRQAMSYLGFSEGFIKAGSYSNEDEIFAEFLRNPYVDVNDYVYRLTTPPPYATAPSKLPKLSTNFVAYMAEHPELRRKALREFPTWEFERVFYDAHKTLETFKHAVQLYARQNQSLVD